MGILKLKYERKTRVDGTASDYWLPLKDFERFNASLLELGDVSKDGEYFEALSAVFDLEGFTSFCNQIDPHLVIPEYMNEFLSWLFDAISTELLQRKDGDDAAVWAQLPFFAKFVGDGVLFLWDTRKLDYAILGNIVVSLSSICDDYRDEFLPMIRSRVSRSPTRLRCGIARGQIISIGDGKDFVGPCINVSSRLQKLGQFSFAFSKRGFDLKKCFTEETEKDFVLVRSSIRGLGDEELIYVRKDEFAKLSKEEKRALKV